MLGHRAAKLSRELFGDGQSYGVREVWQVFDPLQILTDMPARDAVAWTDMMRAGINLRDCVMQNSLKDLDITKDEHFFSTTT